jgi:hypothetical protein
MDKHNCLRVLSNLKLYNNEVKTGKQNNVVIVGLSMDILDLYYENCQKLKTNISTILVNVNDKDSPFFFREEIPKNLRITHIIVLDILPYEIIVNFFKLCFYQTSVDFICCPSMTLFSKWDCMGRIPVYIKNKPTLHLYKYLSPDC